MPFRVLIAWLALCLAAGAQTYYPGTQWRTATPESQGLDSQALASAIDQVRQKKWGVHSLLVIRHGYVVADTDFYPYSSAAPHDLASVTKTITSTLTGVAVGNGLLKLNQPMLSFFPKESPADPDDKKRAITVGNLLHMESGLDCGYSPGERELEQMKRSANWVRYALSLPMKYDPGTHPSYCSPGYHLLGSIIGAAAHMTEADFGVSICSDRSGIEQGRFGRTIRRGGITDGGTATFIRAMWRRSATCICMAGNGTGSRLCLAIGWRCRSRRRRADARSQADWAVSGM